MGWLVVKEVKGVFSRVVFNIDLYIRIIWVFKIVSMLLICNFVNKCNVIGCIYLCLN